MKDIFNKRQRFSIRKFSVGVASVLIGITLFTPSQGVLASTENNLATEIGVNSERENSTPTVEKKQEVQNSPENRGDLSSPAPKDTPIGSTRTTDPATSGDKENNGLTTRASVAGEDRSSTPAVRATSNPSEVKKYELTDEYAKQIKAGVIGSEGNKLDSLLLNGPELSPEAYTDDDYLKDKEELYIYEKGGKKYVGYNSHPMLEDTDGDGIIDSKEKPDEKLKWNVSERDMIMFMELSYRDDNYIDRVLDHKKPLTESELYKKNGDRKPRYEYMMMNKELGPYWERKKSYHTSSGLDAVLYETKSDFLYLPNGTAQVLAFRGTSDVKDIKADITLGTGRNPQQGIDAENIMRELAKDKSITNLYLTGHSLGGYLVQRAMVEAYELAYSDSRVMSPKEQLAYRNFYNNVLKKGTTFNAPKVVTSLVSGREFWQKGLDSKKIAKSGKMTHYIVDNDSTIRKGVSNDSDVVINVGPTSGGHSSRSYFEADMINRRSEFISGKRISLDETGYQDKKITTVKSLEKVGETAVYSKRGDDIIKSTTVSMKDPDTGQITKNTLDEVFKKDGVKDKVEVETIPSPVKYEKDISREKGQDNITVAGKAGSKTTTTTYTVNPNSGEAIAHVGEPVIVNPTETIVKVAAKDKVVETPIELEVEYVKDVEKNFGTTSQRTDGKKGKTVTTTTYDVDPKDGHITEHVGSPVVTPAGKTIVKVGAKTKVERSKDEQGREVINTTTYEVDSKTGKVTPTTVTTYGASKEATVEKKVVPSPVVYEKDDTKEKGTEAITVKGEDGEETITTTYTVDPKTGKIKPVVGQPVRTKEPTNTVVKVPAKDKVDVETIPSLVKYEKDASRDRGQDNITVPGKAGSKTTTTTYTVDPNSGEAIAHVGEPVIVNPTTTIVKVAAKDEVVTSKDGNNIVKTATSYTVNPDNGNIIEHTTKETFKENGLKDKVEVETIPSPVKYEKDVSREKGQDNITVPGKDGSKTTTTTYTVNPDNGEVTPNEGNPVIVNPTETIVKVAAKDKVVETPIEPAVVYEKDDTRDFGTPDQRTEGEKGKAVTTTTYDVDSTDGHITEHVGNSVVTPAGKTIVKVGAKTKVERSKDDQGREVINTTTYEVNPKTGKVTPTTVRTYGKTKAPKVELERNPETGDVTVTPKKPDGSTYPAGTKVEIPGKDGKPITVTIGEDGKGKVPNSELPEGKVPGTGKITEPGKPAVEVPVENPAKVTTENGELPDLITLPEVTIEVRWIDEAGNVLKPSLKTGSEKDSEHGSIPGYEFVQTVIAENEPVMTHIFSKVSGTPTPIPATPPKVTIFENGVLPDSIELSELMIEVRWIDEAGNVLKSSVKSGNEKDAEHGSISGYEFVRTVIAENDPVLTHIFRKVSSNTNTIPVTPETNGNSSHDTPALTTPTLIPVTPVIPDANGNSGQDTAVSPTPIPDAVTPNTDQVDTKTTVDNGAKSNDSQTVLPNTGTESNATLASLGLLGMLGGLGLAFGKKKED